MTNSGENQEVGVKVTPDDPCTAVADREDGTIDVIDPGETKVVTFSDFPDFPFGEGTTVQVKSQPVPGETKTGNNSAEYPVVFSLEARESPLRLATAGEAMFPACPLLDLVWGDIPFPHAPFPVTSPRAVS